MRRGGNWLSGFQHLSYSGRGESRTSTARFHVGNAKKSIEITGGFVEHRILHVFDLYCVLWSGLWGLIRASDRSLTSGLISTPRPQCELSMAMQSPAQDTHTPWYYRGRDFQMSELQLCKHCVPRWWGLWMRMGSGECQADGQHLTHNYWQLRDNFKQTFTTEP